MIYCSLSGGLGNQLFQIFSTISYSIDNNADFLFPNNDILKNSCIDRPTYWKTLLKNLKDYTISYIPNFQIIKEKGFEYNKLPDISYNINITLFGYFQSYKYFQHNFNDICNIIRINEIKHIIRNIYSYQFSNSISLHFRIGDYKKYPDTYPIIGYDYYYNSLLEIKNKTNCFKNITNVLYFCQEEDNLIIEPIIIELKTKFPELLFVKIPDNIEDWKQIILMSLCKHNIIANSTFSWWGAYLNNDKNKIVCYPKNWFGSKLAHYNLNDLFPIEWNKIS